MNFQGCLKTFRYSRFLSFLTSLVSCLISFERVVISLATFLDSFFDDDFLGMSKG